MAAESVPTGNLIRSTVISEIREFIRCRPEPFYVYLLHRPDVTPFYVGKGSEQRIFSHVRDAQNTSIRSHKLHLIRQLLRQNSAIVYELDSFFCDETAAFKRESELIKAIGRLDIGTGPLTNFTDGGEGVSNPSAESKRRAYEKWCRTAGDSEWAVANRFFSRLLPTEAVPIKPADKLRIEALSPHPQPRGFTPRQGATLVASAIANDVHLQPECEIPRTLVIDGREYVIENGAGRDILRSGLARLHPSSKPGHEVLVLTAAGYKYIVSTLDQRVLTAVGVLETA